MKPKATTLQQKMGFSDPDLATPQHDAIMMWLDLNIEKISPAWRQCLLARDACEETRQKIGGIEWPAPLKIWEKPIITRSGFTVGFVDFLYAVSVPTAEKSGDYVWIEQGSLHAEIYEVKPSVCSVGETIRQVRMYQDNARTTLEGLGYKMHLSNISIHPQYFIVSPDNRFQNVLASQGIGFVHVPDGVVDFKIEAFT